MATAYEWTWEVTDDAGDITDSDFHRSYTECRAAAPLGADIALVRTVGTEDEGELERGYAYCQRTATDLGVELPERFDDGYKVPKKYHAEVAR